MQISDIRIRKIYDEGKMKAIVSVTFDDQIVIHDIKIIEGDTGVFIAMPSRKMPNGDFKDIAHPINLETRTLIQEKVLEAYEQRLKELEEEGSARYPGKIREP